MTHAVKVSAAATTSRDVGMPVRVARQGDLATARRIDASLAAIDRPYLLGGPTFWRARIAAVLGDDRGALVLLRQSFREGRGGQGWFVLHVARDFDGLRGQEEFQDLVRPR